MGKARLPGAPYIVWNEAEAEEAKRKTTAKESNTATRERTSVMKLRLRGEGEGEMEAVLADGLDSSFASSAGGDGVVGANSRSVVESTGANLACWLELSALPPDPSKRATRRAAVSASEVLPSITSALFFALAGGSDGAETQTFAACSLAPWGGGLPFDHPGPPIHCHLPSTCFHWFTCGQLE